MLFSRIKKSPADAAYSLNNMRIGSKIILSYFLFMFLPMLAVGTIVVGQMRSSALNTAADQVSADMRGIMQRTGTALAVAMDLSDRLSIDTALQKIATTKFQTTYDVVASYREYKTFQIFLDFNRDVSRIKLYIDNPTLLNDWEFIPVDQTQRDSFWFRAALRNAGTLGWYSFPDVTRPSNSALSLVRSISFGDGKLAAVLVLDVNTDRLSELVRQEQFDTMILDDNGIVAAARDPTLVGKPLTQKDLGALVSSGTTGMTDIAIDGVPSRVFVENFRPPRSFSNLRFVTVFSVGAILSEVNHLTLVATLILVSCFALGFLFLYFLYATLAQRLTTLSQHIDFVTEGNLNVEVPVRGRDEIGHISGQFNLMLEKVRDLMEAVRTSNDQKNKLVLHQRDMQIKMLASQINPHFLFNALESIRMKAHMNGQSEIARTVKSLGRLMRKNLETDGRFILLSDELESVRYYLEIAKFRMEDHIRFDIKIDPGAEGLRIPPLIIEPLVENAVVHGIERKKGGGSVAVSARVDGSRVAIRVSDDGVGMDPGVLAAVRSALGEAGGTHIGLGNVHQRLQWHFGPGAGLVIESDEGSGTEIQFAIPLEFNHV